MFNTLKNKGECEKIIASVFFYCIDHLFTL